jgi:catechol 2,3-dioxygenase-like lactoylglutathione lyase family enzyme
MTDEVGQTILRPILSSTEAHLFVADIQASCDFYADKLGFTVAFVYGDPPFSGYDRSDARSGYNSRTRGGSRNQ